MKFNKPKRVVTIPIRKNKYIECWSLFELYRLNPAIFKPTGSHSFDLGNIRRYSLGATKRRHYAAISDLTEFLASKPSGWVCPKSKKDNGKSYGKPKQQKCSKPRSPKEDNAKPYDIGQIVAETQNGPLMCEITALVVAGQYLLRLDKSKYKKTVDCLFGRAYDVECAVADKIITAYKKTIKH